MGDQDGEGGCGVILGGYGRYAYQEVLPRTRRFFVSHFGWHGADVLCRKYGPSSVVLFCICFQSAILSLSICTLLSICSADQFKLYLSFQSPRSSSKTPVPPTRDPRL